MSHLTASPFHKPSPFQFPQRNNTVESNYNPQLPTPPSMSVAEGHTQEKEYFDTPSVAPEAAGGRFRRAASSIVYHSSGLRESRERTVQRSSRSFLVVLPPSSLPQDHAHLGHTLSSGPRNRLSQGLLMPLFPTMYGQLSAIAREYNFPSTTGLCLYLHINENGITATPRISDDSWQMIWSHIFDGQTTGTGHLPVCGKVEFDIDLHLARWYGAWMASSHREHGVDVPMSVTPSAAPSVVHYREESRTTFADGDDGDNHSIIRPVRHVPRKLSLVDRFDVMSVRSVPRSVVARALPEGLHGSQNLSPIFQEEEPKTAKFNDLEHRVNSWRASASILPETTGHILLASVISPPLEESPITTSNKTDGEHPEPAEEEEYRIEDYSFSISSAGPGDYDPHSPLTWYYDPSVHMANRAEGSVCLTPTECTSFGPSEYPWSPRHYEFDMDGLVYTPDIGRRMLEDVPPSPLTTTSWGAPLSYPPTPVSDYHAPSVHLAYRGEFSRPTTPMTATSWGAPESFPPSPTTPFYVRTPDAAERSFDFSAIGDAPWSLVWPYHDTTRPWNQVWPYRSSDLHQNSSPAASTAWNMVWPYHAVSVSAPWEMVWPYHQSQSTPSPSAISVSLPAAYPAFDLYPATYPHNLDEIYPALAQEVSSSDISTHISSYPSLNIYPAVYPNFEIYPRISAAWDASTSSEINVRLAPGPSIYPQNLREIYPIIGAVKEQSLGPINVRLTPGLTIYPDNLDNIYPAVNSLVNVRLAHGPSVYPQNLDEIYPSLSPLRRVTGLIDIVLPPSYPVFSLYRAVYPWNLDVIYPPVKLEDSIEITTRLTAYPCFNIYPAVYPNFDIYPAISGAWKHDSVSLRGSITVRLAVGDAIYPHNLVEIYPSIVPVARPTGGITTRLAAHYPVFDLYPAVYPHVVPYPPTQGEMEKPLWTVVYPHFDLYPAIGPKKAGSIELSVRQSMAYPYLDIYPAVYPYVTPYPSASGEMAAPTYQVDYPVFNLYPAIRNSTPVHHPAVYPHIVPYPPVERKASHFDPIVIRQSRYPVFDLYPATYPPVPYPSAECEMQDEIQVRPEPLYPFIALYDAVYPYLDLYPTLLTMPDPRPPRQSRFTRSDLHALVKNGPRRNMSRTHQELHLQVFAQGTEVVTPSGGGAQPRVMEPTKSHLDLHHEVFPLGTVVVSPSGAAPIEPSPSPRSMTRLRSGSVIRNSLPPSPRPVGGRPISMMRVAAAPPAARPATAPRPHQARKGLLCDQSPLCRSSSMALPKSSPPPPSLDRSASTNGPAPRKRDSLVLQRVRALQMHDAPPITEEDVPRPPTVRKLTS
ncbi:hypothetical protein MIND_00733200 [Mycena indigotica]|uniref:Uncharacterized protein n=1 Tax=Mycena indigotica TaxID=2126181 RepID=A0A8H6SNV2_9AGAR|nr:uncharacterized protein MIND_00733200 [Mycena indigotica]KAF7301677.1 hypothetical protein MIND_00733200 [Mycena indigotica]